MDFMPLRLNSSSLTCSICALAAIILQLVAMECQKLYMVDSPIDSHMSMQEDKRLLDHEKQQHSVQSGKLQNFST